ncbi:MAG: hypothetical protein UU23_C0002G0014 [Candidatus Curtissbacteria bacterium GW2011_GWA1_40_9]|uniref:Uncharacterized protein n=1 Tax=Candidatus Curtissbacteria bacterium GW2011_GWA1_40_9 TaxID=1618408 RepID=A0A0G0WS40_9BACT|nr:MAG: hypothetical protein UU23_C0002G0014 [Candidatus Curtissbacteria bacterium GW2011_GWA1_40_9]
MRHHLLTISLNFSAFLLLLTLVAAPIYFAKNITQIAGVKSESPYLLVSQIEKFPGMTFSQTNNTYTVSFTKQAPKQAYLSILVINNPTKEAKTYKIHTTDDSDTLFFGEDINRPETQITLTTQTSAPISILSKSNSFRENVSFNISLL